MVRPFVSLLPVLLSLVFAADARAADGGITGTVRDASGGVVVGAGVSLLTAEQAVVGSTRTDARGRFGFAAVRPGRYLLVVGAPGFAETRMAVTPGEGGADGVAVTLAIEGVETTVSVTGTRGVVQDVAATGQAVTIVDEVGIEMNAKEVVGQAVAEQTGVHLLRTSPTMAGIYVRGLTGAKVNVFVDGVRYSTSTARGGVNTFLDLIEPTNLQGVEVLRGANSAQYGSDALGGSVQFLSQVPSLAAAGHGGVHGIFAARGGTASSNIGANLALGYQGGTFGIFGNLAARTVNDMRPGDGVDSHAAVTRFLGVPSDTLMPANLPETGFNHSGGYVRMNWAPTSNQQVMLNYSRTRQPDGKRYDQLLGGDGNLVADLRDLSLDFFYAKYQRIGFGWFDQVTASYSYNSQYEERVNQGGNGNPKNTITSEPERTNAQGFQAQASKRIGERHNLLLGGEYYPERVHAPSTGYNPVTQVTSIRRGRVPDNASYRSGAGYVQDVFDAITDRLQVMLNARYSGAAYKSLAADSPLVNGKPLWPDDSLTVSNVSFRAGVSVTPGVDGLSFTANVSRGFRAPSITDLGTVGLTGSGYQVSAKEVEGMGATVGSTANASAVATGIPVEQVWPETSLSYRGRRPLPAEVVQHRLLRVRQRRLRQRRLPVADPAAGRRRPAARRSGDLVAGRERRGLRPGELVSGAGADQLRRRTHLRLRALVQMECLEGVAGPDRAHLPARGRPRDERAAEHRRGYAGAGWVPEGALHAAVGALVGRGVPARRRAPDAALDARPRGPADGRDSNERQHQELLLQRRDGAGLGVAGP